MPPASGSSGPTTVRPMLLFLGEADQIIEIVDIDRDIDAVERRAGVARSAENPLDARRLRELPHQGVFASAFADDEDFHAVLPRDKGHSKPHYMQSAVYV